MRAAIYCRVSTADQTATPQLDALRAYAAARGLHVVQEYVDAGVSGARARRPALDQLVGDARRRVFDVVLIVKLDRLARSLHHLVQLAAEWEAIGVGIVCTDQAGVDTTTPNGRLLFGVLASVAEFERTLVIERTRAGVEAARRRGRHPGRPRLLDAQRLARARRLHENGKSFREVGALLGCSASAILRSLRR